VATLKLELGIGDTESFGKETLSHIHRNLSADYVVAGSYFAPYEPGKPIRVDIRLQDTAAGETMASLTDTAAEADLSALVARSERNCAKSSAPGGRPHPPRGIAASQS